MARRRREKPAEVVEDDDFEFAMNNADAERLAREVVALFSRGIMWVFVECLETDLFPCTPVLRWGAPRTRPRGGMPA